MRYRIKKEEYSDGRLFFYPQYKYDYLPIWFNFSGSEWAILCYSYAEAKNVIDRYKKKVKINTTYIDIF